MTQEELVKLLYELRALPSETEWVEFKCNYVEPEEIGEYLSALSNSACVHNKEKGYVVFGIENETHNIRQYGQASRQDIDNLLLNKLPDVLSERQKFNKINRLLSAIMAKKLNLIKNIGSRRSPVWVLAEQLKDG